MEARRMRIQSEWNRLHDDVERLESECKAKDAEIARLKREVEEANRKYEKAYDCHGMMCGACISCCVEMLHDTSAKNTILYADLAAAKQFINRFLTDRETWPEEYK